MRVHRLAFPLTLAVVLVGALGLSACSDDPTTPAGPVGGPVKGEADAHCAKAQVTTEAACTTPPGAGGGGGAGGAGTGGAPHGHGGEGGHADMDEYGATLFNAEGDDDECKYNLKWTATDIRQNQDVTFTVTIATKADGKAAAGAKPNIEAFLSDTHPAPNSSQSTKETSPGVYTVGPVRLDAAGDWTVRFHIHEECIDGPESPHGHVAFFVRVP